MAKLTIFFGVVLMVLGVVSYVATGSQHATALIPCWFGLVLGLFGVLALTDDSRKRMIFMHIAVTVGLLGFLFPGAMSITALVKAHMQHTPVFRPEAVHEQLIMAGICLLFVLLCVRSFIAARLTRLA